MFSASNRDWRRRPGVPAALLVVLFLSACGGGGGGSDDGPGSPSGSNTVSGIALLGPVAGADVAIVGTDGVLATGTTGSDGRFGPLEIPGAYGGPLRIEVSGNGAATWTCDFRLGCTVGGGFHPAGGTIGFDGTLEAVLPAAGNTQFVTVSLLSHAVSQRVEVLGGLTQANVENASADVADLLRTVLAEVTAIHDFEVPEDFSTLELFDLNDLPSPGGADDALRTVLSLLNSSLAGLAVVDQTTGEFIDAFGAAIANQPSLPISAPNFFDPSLESLLTVLFVQVVELWNSGNAVLVGELDELLAPGNVLSLLDALLAEYTNLPALVVLPGQFEYFVFVDDFTMEAPITHLLEVTNTTGAALALPDFGVAVQPVTGGTWLSASTVMLNGLPHLQLDFDRAALSRLENGTYETFVEIYSQTGDFARAAFSVILDLNVVSKPVDAGLDITADERSTIVLDGSTNRPDEVANVSWVQVDGPAVQISNPGVLTPHVTLPGLNASEDVTLRLDIEFTAGETLSDSVVIHVVAFPDIADLDLPDDVLQQCIADAAAAGGFIETPEITTLTCSGVSDLSGLDVFTGLVSLELPDNDIGSLQSLLGLENLQFLDVSGTPGLPCAEIDALAERLEEGVELLVDDICRGAIDIDLGADGFDAAVDEARQKIYVSVPDRKEIAVISTADLRIVDRIALGGSPRGIDLSIDGTRLFAALHGSTSVVVVDIDAGTVSPIPLGDTTGHSSTWDVVEGSPDRLFVTASPDSSGFAWVAQVMLDQGNSLSRVANESIIRAQPTLARSPNHDFVYVGEGFSPNSLYKLSLADPAAPIVLEDDHGSVGGTDNLAVNLAGTRIALRSGQVLRTGSFIEEGTVTAGPSVAGTTGDVLFVATDGGNIEAFDFTSLIALGTTPTGCDAAATSRLVVFAADERFLLLQGSNTCLYSDMSRSAPADPLAALRFPDLGLEECVIDAAVTNGFTTPEEFTVLDCSGTMRAIRDLDGIERLVNLEHLTLSNSGVFDLSPLGALPALQTLVLQNASIGDVSPLFALATLSSVDLIGNPGVACADLDRLVLNGVAVQANECTETVRIELPGIGADLALDAAGDRAFVSVGGIAGIREIDLAGGSIAGHLDAGGTPQGIDLSADGHTLYSALYGLGAVSVLDTDSGALPNVIDILIELDHNTTWDVAEVSPGRVVVSANPGSGGLAYIVEVRPDTGSATRVADQTIIRGAPIFTVSPDGLSVYVGEGFSPNSLYKLDATQATLPLILQDDHGEVHGADSLTVSPDGSRIYLGSGQALDTTTFFQVAQFPSGRSAISADGTVLLIGDAAADAALLYDTETTRQVGSRTWGCDILDLTALHEYGDGVLALGDDLVCYGRVVSYP